MVFEHSASKEKQRVAWVSVAAAVLLTGGKLVVGFMTGSLGILAEAAHSGLDLIAALVTCVAVHFSDRPADQDHHYGHGKVENLSALIETVLLLVTCVWIVYEAVHRLFFEEVMVDASIWAFGVVLLSIVVDFTRSRALKRVAVKYNSQALEADALHFETDIWSSAVVFVGLILVRVGQQAGGGAFWARADSIAALMVALIVVHVSIKLGRKTIDVLLDRAPSGIDSTIKHVVRSIEGVEDCRQLRIRQSGSQAFIDLVVDVHRGTSLESSHAITLAIEERIRTILPQVDVVIHIDPVCDADETILQRIYTIAANHGQTVHNILLAEEGDRLCAELHLEMDEHILLKDAHAAASRLEQTIHSEIPRIAEVTTHIEPHQPPRELIQDLGADSDSLIRQVHRVVEQTSGIVECHNVTVRRAGHEIFLTMHCTFDSDISVRQMHDISSRLEFSLRKTIPHLARVTTHPEPPEDADKFRSI